MKLCQSCWDKLRAAIDARGLGHLVAKSGEVAVRQVVAIAQGDDAKENYDPLMAANFAIWSQALSSFGLSMMCEGAPCPLCEKTRIESTCTEPKCSKQTGDDWINFAADDQLRYAQERGYAPKPS